MIDLKDLNVGEWYDGFLHHNGKQRCTETMRWHTVPGWPRGYFYSKDEGEAGYHDGHKANGSYTFEPNVISTGEPAS